MAQSNRYSRRLIAKSTPQNLKGLGSEDVIYNPDKLYERIKMRTYDVIMMTEEQFLRISQFPNWGLIQVIDDEDYAYDLAHTIKYYNSDLYNKFQLLFTEFETPEPVEGNRESDDAILQKEVQRLLGSMITGNYGNEYGWIK